MQASLDARRTTDRDSALWRPIGRLPWFLQRTEAGTQWRPQGEGDEAPDYSPPLGSTVCRTHEKMDNYVVRIYRRAGKKSRILIGTVEVAGTETKTAFSNADELWEILSRRRNRTLFAPPGTRHGPQKDAKGATVALAPAEPSERE